jgi:hypothetical protein
MQKKSARKCVNNVLRELQSFGVKVEVDPSTFEVLGVSYPQNKYS